MLYSIQIVRSAQKQILSFPRDVQTKIVRTIDSLASMPRPIGCKKLKGVELWRQRVGHYRVIYQINDETRMVTIVKAALRKEDTYRGL